MPLPVIADTLQVAVQGTTGIGTRWANVIGFRKTPILTFTAAIAIIDPLLLKLYAGPTFGGGGLGWNNNAANTCAVQQFVYTPLDGASAQTVIPHAVAGTSAAEEGVPGGAIVFTLRTALRGRSKRGRVYWGGFSETVSSGGIVPAPA